MDISPKNYHNTRKNSYKNEILAKPAWKYGSDFQLFLNQFENDFKEETEGILTNFL